MYSFHNENVPYFRKVFEQHTKDSCASSTCLVMNYTVIPTVRGCLYGGELAWVPELARFPEI